MAKSICARCGGSTFERATVLNCAVLQCATCGAVAGTLAAGAAPTVQEAKLDQISQQVHRIDAGLRAIVEALNKL